MTCPDDTKDFFTAILTLSGALWVLSLPALQSLIIDLNAAEYKAKARYAIIVVLAASVILFTDMIASLFKLLPLSEQGNQLKYSVLAATFTYGYVIAGYRQQLQLWSTYGTAASLGVAMFLLAILATVFFMLPFFIVAQIMVAALGAGPIFFLATTLSNIRE